MEISTSQEVDSDEDGRPMEPRSSQRSLKTNPQGKYLSRAMRLSYNSITNLCGLLCVLNDYLAKPWNLGLLDLSFNRLSYIDTVLCNLRDLRVLYLHGNCISHLPEVDKLALLPRLHTITLHGNSIAAQRIYRRYVIFVLPQLKKIDFNAVTPGERVLAQALLSEPEQKHREESPVTVTSS